jgi:hypothetical protein
LGNPGGERDDELKIRDLLLEKIGRGQKRRKKPFYLMGPAPGE